MSSFGNLLIKLILDLLLSFKLQNIKRKQLIRKAKYKRFVKKLWFFMQLQLHFLWKTLPLKSLFVQYAVFFYPSYRVENQDEYIWGFGLLSDRLKSLKQLPSSEYVDLICHQFILMLLLGSFVVEVDVWVVLYKVDLFKILFKVVSLIEFFILIAICMYIFDTLIVTWRQASTDKTLITILEKVFQTFSIKIR